MSAIPAPPPGFRLLQLPDGVSPPPPGFRIVDPAVDSSSVPAPPPGFKIVSPVTVPPPAAPVAATAPANVDIFEVADPSGAKSYLRVDQATGQSSPATAEEYDAYRQQWQDFRRSAPAAPPPAPVERGLIGGVGAGLVRGVGNALQAVAGAQDASAAIGAGMANRFINFIDPPQGPQEQAQRDVDRREVIARLTNETGKLAPMKSVGAAISAAAPASASVDAGGAIQPTNWRWYTERASESVPLLLTQIGLLAATRGQSASAQFAAFAAPAAISAAGSTYNEATARGTDPGVAAGEGMLNGAIAAVLQKVSIGPLLSASPTKAFFQNAILNRVAAMGTKGLAEGGANALVGVVQEAAGDTVHYVAENDPAAFKDWQSRYAGAAVQGGGAGFVGGVVHGAASPQEPVGRPQEAVGTTPTTINIKGKPYTVTYDGTTTTLTNETATGRHVMRVAVDPMKAAEMLGDSQSSPAAPTADAPPAPAPSATTSADASPQYVFDHPKLAQDFVDKMGLSTPQEIFAHAANLMVHDDPDAQQFGHALAGIGQNLRSDADAARARADHVLVRDGKDVPVEVVDRGRSRVGEWVDVLDEAGERERVPAYRVRAAGEPAPVSPAPPPLPPHNMYGGEIVRPLNPVENVVKGEWTKERIADEIQQAYQGGRSGDEVSLLHDAVANQQTGIHPDDLERMSPADKRLFGPFVSEEGWSNRPMSEGEMEMVRAEGSGASSQDAAIDWARHHQDPAIQFLAWMHDERTGKQKGEIDISTPEKVDAMLGKTWKINGKPFRITVDDAGDVHLVDDDVAFAGADRINGGKIPFDRGSLRDELAGGDEGFAPAETVPERLRRLGSTPAEVQAEGPYRGDGPAEQQRDREGDNQRGWKFGEKPNSHRNKTEVRPKGGAVDPKSAIGHEGDDNSPLPEAKEQKFGPGAAAKVDPAFREEPTGRATAAEAAPKVKDTVTAGEAEGEPVRPPTIPERLRATAARTADAIARYAQKSFPSLTRASRAAGEAAATLISTREKITYSSQYLTAKVLGGEKVGGEFDRKLGAVLVEDQLRGIRQKFVDAQDADAAAKVRTLVGAKDSPFKTEEDYQRALNDPHIQAGLAAHRQFAEPIFEENFKLSAGIDPETPVPVRGRDTNSHLSLKAILPEEHASLTSLPGGGSIQNTLRKHSMLEREAKGTADQYELNYSSLVTNTLEKGTLPADQARFYEALVKAKVAIIAPPGERPTIDNQPTVGLPLEKRGARQEYLYIKKDVAGEARLALRIDRPDRPLESVSKIFTGASLLSGVEASSHLANHLAVLIKSPLRGEHLPTLIANVPGVGKLAGILDAVGTRSINILTKDLNTQQQLMELAEIGALKPEYFADKPTGIQKLNPIRYVAKAIDHITTAARLALDDGYRLLVDKGIAPDTPTARRDFVNQVGQYHKEAQAGLVRVFRNTGLGPFATAGSTFYTQGVKAVLLDAGVKATSRANALKLRAYVASQLLGPLVQVAIANYLRTGKLQPPGTPWGSLYLYTKDDERPVYFDFADFEGLKRGARAFGIDATIEQLRKGASGSNTLDKAMRQAESAAISPFAGPIPTFISEAATGYTPHGMYNIAGDANKGESNQLNRLVTAGKHINPTIGMSSEASEHNLSFGEALASQFGKFAPRIGDIPRTQAEYKAIELLRDSAAHAPQTEEGEAKFKAKMDAIDAMRKKDPDAEAKVEKLVKDGVVKRADLGELRKRGRMTLLEDAVNRLSPEDAVHVFEVADAAERKKLEPELRRKIAQSRQTIPEKMRLRERINKAAKP